MHIEQNAPFNLQFLQPFIQIDPTIQTIINILICIESHKEPNPRVPRGGPQIKKQKIPIS